MTAPVVLVSVIWSSAAIAGSSGGRVSVPIHHHPPKPIGMEGGMQRPQIAIKDHRIAASSVVTRFASLAMASCATARADSTCDTRCSRAAACSPGLPGPSES
jgi:hypothetical protein